MTVECLYTEAEGFHKGGVYNVVDGRVIDDQGLPRPLMVKRGLEPIKAVEDIKNYKNGNWSWIGHFTLVSTFDHFTIRS